jgi:hypothetical protein
VSANNVYEQEGAARQQLSTVRNELPGVSQNISVRGVGGETSITPRELNVRAVVVARWAFVQQ